MALIAVQYFWLSSAVRSKQDEFDRRVLAAMRATAVLLEEKSTLKMIAESFPEDSLNEMVDTNLVRIIKKVGKNDAEETVNTVVQVERRGDSRHVVIQTQNKSTAPPVAKVQTVFALPEPPAPPEPPALPANVADVISKVEGECKAAGSDWNEVLDSSGLAEALYRQLIRFHLPGEVTFAVLRSGDSSMLLSTQPHKVSDFAYQTELMGFDFTGKGLWLLVDFPDRGKHVWASLAGMLVLSLLFTAVILGVFIMALRLILKQKKVNEVTADFISNMTHEFKTPLATISMAADTMQLATVANSNGQVNEYAGMIKQEANRLSKHVDRILEAAAEKMEEPTYVDLVKILQKQLQLNENMLLQCEAIMHLQLPDEPVVVIAQEDNLGYVVSNLLDNAIKYSNGKPEITVEVRVSKTIATLKIADKGIGIRKEDREIIFEKFFRAHTGNRHDVKGFGLGLSFVKTNVQLWGGTVWVESEPGKGSTFFVELKLAQP